MSLSDILTGTDISDFISGYKKNPLWQQSQIQLGNQQALADAAKNAYQGMLTEALPQQTVAAFDPDRYLGLQMQQAAAEGGISNMFGNAASTLGGFQSGAGMGTGALTDIAGGGGGPTFNLGVAQDMSNFMNPQLISAQQALANQANMAWNRGAANIADGGGFMSSGRNAMESQAKQNMATQLASQQQQLAYDAATRAATAGGAAGLQGAQNRLSAAGTLGQQGLGAMQMMPAISQGMLLPGQIREAAGATTQQQRQNELNAQYANQMGKFQNPFRALQNYQSALGVLGSQNYAPNMQVPNNVMALMSLLGISPTSLAGGSSNNILGPLLSGIGGGAVDLIGDLGSWINNNIFGGFFADGGYLPAGQIGVAGERGPEIVNGQMLPKPALISGPAQITPMSSNMATSAKSWF